MRGRKMSGLAPAEHDRLGRLIHEFRTAMMCTENPTWRNYPKSSKQVHSLERLLRALDEYKNQMDNAVCREYPRFNAAVKIYYGRDHVCPEDEREIAEWLAPKEDK